MGVWGWFISLESPQFYIILTGKEKSDGQKEIFAQRLFNGNRAGDGWQLAAGR
jgi:hypothetical protein